MPEWFTNNLNLISTITGIVTALIWLVYLQILVNSVMRQRRKAISINRGGGAGRQAHILVTNLGYEPVYIREVFMTLHTDTGERDVILTERDEYRSDDLSDPLKSTLQGPLESGAYITLGTLEDIYARGRARVDLENVAAVQKVEFVVLAVGKKMTGARKVYRKIVDGGSVERLLSGRAKTEQLSPWRCRRLERRFSPYD